MFTISNTALSVAKGLESNMKKNKNERKMNAEDVQGLLAFRRRGYWVKNKKGKASYDRAQFKRAADCV